MAPVALKQGYVKKILILPATFFCATNACGSERHVKTQNVTVPYMQPPTLPPWSHWRPSPQPWWSLFQSPCGCDLLLLEPLYPPVNTPVFTIKHSSTNTLNIHRQIHQAFTSKISSIHLQIHQAFTFKYTKHSPTDHSTTTHKSKCPQGYNLALVPFFPMDTLNSFICSACVRVFPYNTLCKLFW